MTRKEKTQQTRFDNKIAPLLKEISSLCKKFEMPMLTAVQLFVNEEDGARIETSATHPQAMTLPMTLSTSIMNGSTQVRINENNMLQFIIPKGEMPEELIQFSRESDVNGYTDDVEPLAEHALHCTDCAILMEEVIAKGENVDNIFVPRHDDLNIQELVEDMKTLKLPFIIPKNPTIH